MLGKSIVPSFILFALLPLVLFAATGSAVSACDLGPDSDTGCGDWHIRQRQFVRAPVAAIAVANVPRGDSPDHALDIIGNWTSIEPGAGVWYKTPNSDGYRDIALSVDSPTQNALGLALFSPDQQIGSWGDWKPVGRGTFNSGQPEHVLTWIAGYARSGVWYALVQNHSNATVSYRLTGNLSTLDAKSCHGYWEVNRYGQMIYWIDCGHYTTVP